MLHGDLTRLTRRCGRPSLASRCARLRLDLRQRLAPHHRLGADALFDHRVAPRMQRAEAEVLQLGLDQVHAQPLRDRRVDLQRLAGDALARLRRLRAERAHVVQAVGELDQDHAQVARHRQQHLAEAFGGRFLAVAELQLVQLGDAVDQLGDGLAEFAGDRLAGQRRVLDRVVQDRRDQGLDVQPLLGQHLRHRDRMGDVGLAGLAGLAGVRGGADRPGAAQQPRCSAGQVVGGLLQLERRSRAPPRRAAWRRSARAGGTHGASLRARAPGGNAACGGNSGPPTQRPREGAVSLAMRDSVRRGSVVALGHVVVGDHFGGGPFQRLALLALALGLVDGVDEVGRSGARRSRAGPARSACRSLRCCRGAARRRWPAGARAWRPSSRVRSGCRPLPGNLRR